MKGKSKYIKHGDVRTLSILMHPSYAGHYEDTLELIFLNLEFRRTFVITRRICGTVGSREDHEQLKPKEPYARKQLTRFRPDGNVIPSIRPPVWTRIKWAQGLPKYPVPRPLLEAAFGAHQRNPNAVRVAVKRFMPPAFNPVTYGSWFQVLVYLEEEQSRRVRHFALISYAQLVCLANRLLLDMYSLENVELKANYPRYE
jgi:helicase MOV-10